MKKENYKKLILMGIAGGMCVSTQALADEENSSSNIQIQESIAAKARCKGNHGCPGLTSDKEKNQEVKYYDPEKDGALQKGNQDSKKNQEK